MHVCQSYNVSLCSWCGARTLHNINNLGLCIRVHVYNAVLRLRGSICHMRGFIFTNARKIYYHLRVSIARFLITFTGNLDI